MIRGTVTADAEVYGIILLWGAGSVILPVMICALIRLFTKRFPWGGGSLMILTFMFLPYTALFIYGE